MTGDRVLLWSGEHHAYWRPNSAGYTIDGLAAGLYPRAEAERIVAGCDPEKRVEIREINPAWPILAAKQSRASTPAVGREAVDILDRACREKPGLVKGFIEVDTALHAISIALAIHPLSTPAVGREAIEAAARAMCDRVNGICDYDENIEQRRSGWMAQAEAGLKAAILALHPPVMGEVEAALAWFGEQRRLSLAHYSPMYGDDDDQSVEWRVERESGPINDREWDIVGRGATPIAAILAARAASSAKR